MSPRQRISTIAGIAGAIVLVAWFGIAGASPTDTATDDSTLCTAAQGPGNHLTAAQKTWAQQCVAVFAEGKRLYTPPASPSPSVSPTVSPSPSASPSASPTASPSASPSSSPSPSPSQSSTGPLVCPVAGSNLPGAADPYGGCFPGPGNTGVPADAVLGTYTGSCTIATSGTVLDHVHVYGAAGGTGSMCATLTITGTNVTIRNSLLSDVDLNDGDSTGDPGSFTITDSTVTNGSRDQCACVGYHDFTATRVNVVGGNRSMYCIIRCSIVDSWLHGQQLTGAQHGSGLRVEEFTTATHDTLACDYSIVHDSTTLGCSAPQTGYADFAAIHDNTLTHNLYMSSNQGAGSDDPGTPNVSYCGYGGNTQGKPHSGDAGAGTHIEYIGNVFQRGTTGVCGTFGVFTDFNPAGSGNVWAGNMFDNGASIPATSAE